jgi:hypothetical protein
VTFLDAIRICHSPFDNGASEARMKARFDAYRATTGEVEKLYELADLLIRADRALGTIRNAPADFDALWDRQTYPADALGPMALEVRKIADRLQDAIDGED